MPFDITAAFGDLKPKLLVFRGERIVFVHIAVETLEPGGRGAHAFFEG